MRTSFLFLGTLVLIGFLLALPLAAAEHESVKRSLVRPAAAYYPSVASYPSYAPSYAYTPSTAYAPAYARSRPSSTFSSTSKYSESPGFTRAPVQSFRQNKAANEVFSDFDSSSSGYDYRGPMFERQTVQRDDFAKDSFAKSGLFSARSSDSLRHSISTTVTEKYLGATESLFSNNQNRRASSKSGDEKTSYDADEGFTFGKQRVFDASEYAKDAYSAPYYYRPVYDSQGYYNWRY